MCHLDRTRRKQYEGGVNKRCGVTRKDEVRKWDQGPRWEVEGNGDPHYRDVSQNRSLQISQSISVKKSKLIRFLWQFIGQVRCHVSRWVWKENRRMKSSYKRPEVFTTKDIKTIGSRRCVNCPMGCEWVWGGRLSGTRGETTFSFISMSPRSFPVAGVIMGSYGPDL